MSHSATVWKTRVESGLCGRCGNPPVPGTSECASCKEDKRRLRQGRYKLLASQNKCVDCMTPNQNGFLRCDTCKTKRSTALVKERLRLKLEVFNAYGGAICSCTNCPERLNPKIELLTINHINGGGTKHRKALGGKRIPGGGVTHGGYATYRWLRKNNFPSGFNVLCWNCQWGIHINNGVCPHSSIGE